MQDSPSTIGTIEEEKYEIKFNDSVFYQFDSNPMSLPPPPSIFANRQNSIQSNNSKDNELHSIFSNPNISHTSINDSVDSIDNLYVTDYNQSFDLIPDVLDQSRNPSFDSQFEDSYSFYNHFDSHNQNHLGYHSYHSYDNLDDITNYAPNHYTAPTPQFKEGSSRLHKYKSDMHLSRINTSFPAGAVNPISATHISPASASASSLTPTSTLPASTPIKPDPIPLSTFRHNPPIYHFHQSQTYPRRRTTNSIDTDDSTPTTNSTTTNSISTPNSTANSPLAGSGFNLNYNMHQPQDTLKSDKPKKYTRRRLLPRSKNGCWICRIKHLKCDEVRPVCTSCTKFGIQCDYAIEKPLYVLDKDLRREKLLEITKVRKSNQRLKPKSSKRKLKE